LSRDFFYARDFDRHPIENVKHQPLLKTTDSTPTCASVAPAPAAVVAEPVVPDELMGAAAAAAAFAAAAWRAASAWAWDSAAAFEAAAVACAAAAAAFARATTAASVTCAEPGLTRPAPPGSPRARPLPLRAVGSEVSKSFF